MHYYPHHVGDYQRDTAHLTLLEHGCYRLMMDYCYASERPLPTDHKQIFQIIRASAKTEKEAALRVLGWFFHPVENGFSQPRIEREVKIYSDLRMKASDAGKASAEKRKALKINENTSTVVQRSLDSGCNETATDGQPTKNHEPRTILLLEADASEVGDVAKEKKQPKPSTADPRHTEFIRAWTESWPQAFYGESYPFKKHDGINLATLLKTSKLSTDELMAGVKWCWTEIATNPRADWAVKQAGTISGFCTNYASILAANTAKHR